MGYNSASLVTEEVAPPISNPLTAVAHTLDTTYTYDDAGRVTQKTEADPAGHDTSRTWRYGYDSAGHLTSTTTPDNAATTQHWNTAGDLTTVTQPNGLTVQYTYDDFRHLIETDALGSGVDPADPSATRMALEARTYDPAGELASVIDANGRETDYTYFSDGLTSSQSRVRRATTTDGSTGDILSQTTLEKYEYDSGGDLIRVTDAGGLVHDYDYDDAGNRNRESVDASGGGVIGRGQAAFGFIPQGVERSTIYTYTADNSVATRKDSNGYTLATGRTSEIPYLFQNNGSQLDGENSRYADGDATFTYKFTVPSDTSDANLNIEVDNQYAIWFSSDDQNWTQVAQETRDIRDGSNRQQHILNLDSYLPTLATSSSTLAPSTTQRPNAVYVKIGDSQPATG
jgi:YD repeat-containing protein